MISIASLSFAEIKFTNGWGCIEYRALASIGSTTDLGTAIGANWGGTESASLDVQARGDKGGLFGELAFGSGNTSPAISYLYFWQKPIDGLKVVIGSKAALGTLQVHSNNNIFTSLDSANGPAFIAEYTGVQNLYLGVAIPTAINGWNNAVTALASTYAATQFAADYTIGGVGRIRAQYIGDATTTDTNYGTIEVAAVTSGWARGITADVGVKIPLKTAATYNVNIEGTYSNGPLWTELWIMNNITPSATSAYSAYYSVEALYNISGPYSVGIFLGDSFASSTSNTIEAKPYFRVQHGLDNGYIRGQVYFDLSTDVLATTPAITWRLPVYLEYCFW